MQFTTVFIAAIAATMATASPVAAPVAAAEVAAKQADIPLIDLWQQPWVSQLHEVLSSLLIPNLANSSISSSPAAALSVPARTSRALASRTRSGLERASPVSAAPSGCKLLPHDYFAIETNIRQWCRLQGNWIQLQRWPRYPISSILDRQEGQQLEVCQGYLNHILRILLRVSDWRVPRSEMVEDGGSW